MEMAAMDCVFKGRCVQRARWDKASSCYDVVGVYIYICVAFVVMLAASGSTLMKNIFIT